MGGGVCVRVCVPVRVCVCVCVPVRVCVWIFFSISYLSFIPIFSYSHTLKHTRTHTHTHTESLTLMSSCKSRVVRLQITNTYPLPLPLPLHPMYPAWRVDRIFISHRWMWRWGAFIIFVFSIYIHLIWIFLIFFSIYAKKVVKEKTTVTFTEREVIAHIVFEGMQFTKRNNLIYFGVLRKKIITNYFLNLITIVINPIFIFTTIDGSVFSKVYKVWRPIVVEMCRFSILSTRIEVTLRKAESGGLCVDRLFSKFKEILFLIFGWFCLEF